MHLVRDLLDKQLVESDENKIGKVDGLVIEARDGSPPRIAAIETGAGVVLDRLGWRTSGHRYRIAFEKIIDVGVDVAVDVDPEQMPLVQWQDWLRRRVLRWIPGGSA
jgi:sporulation protein YlmC with PRC-barrel domain